MGKKAILASLMLAVSISELSATTLKEIVSEVLDTNPVIIERLRNYRATKEEIGIAEAGYYPTLDIQSSVGRKYTGRLSGDGGGDTLNETYSVFQNSLILRQSIFNGFSTHEQVNYQKMRTLAAGYSYLEKANDVTLQTIKVYIDLLRNQELLRNSNLNVEHNTELYRKVSKAYKAGLTSLSEVSKIQSSLSLAKSNMMVQKNRLANAIFNFRRVTGRIVSIKDLKKPNFNIALPQNKRSASMYALEYNPSLLVGKYNIKGAEALYRESKSKFYPKIDFEASENYNQNYNEFTGIDDRFQAMLVVSYNLYNGGADEAAKRNKISKLSQEVAVTDDLKRQVIEGMELSWGAYDLALEQIPFLTDYKKQSGETLKLYSKEYELGERSLLDLLATENDLKRANDELINAKYNLLLSKYRILDAMGLTMASIMGNVQKYYQRVGIFNQGKSTPSDTLPRSFDKDNDGVVSNKDLCANSKKRNGLLPFGCTKSISNLESIRL
ncbi:Type I secretion system, outer membrane component LapE |uniref:Type I secretion system, outer membrane component LapE \